METSQLTLINKTLHNDGDCCS